MKTMVDFQRGTREVELEQRTQDFIRNVVLPFERDPRCHSSTHGPAPDLIGELQDKARAAGLLAPHVSEAWGGLGLNYRECATVFRAAGYSLLGPLAMNCMAPDEGNMHLLEVVATHEQKERYLRDLVAGRCKSAFLMTEPHPGAGSDPELLVTTATKDGAHWIISGRKWFITGSSLASFGIVMARTSGGATMFLIDMAAPGVTIERQLHTLGDAMPGGHGVVRLDEVRVPEAMVLGEVDQGFRYAQVRLAPARLTHCMRWWGAAKRAHDIATQYASTRRGFGKPLIEHEGVGFVLARNEVDLLQTQVLIDYVAWTLDQGSKANTESSMAKYACAETFYAIVDRCVQVLGSQGVTHETPVGLIFQELRAFRIYDGPSEVHLWSLARRLQRNVASRNAGAG
jgi:acyl-CoA dehydrogenase